MKQIAGTDTTTRSFGRLLYLLAPVLVLALLAGDAFAAWTSLRPQNSRRQKIEIDGKVRSYYELDATHATEFELNGPAEIRVYSRVPYSRGVKGERYSFSYTIDGENPTVLRHKISRSRTARLVDEGDRMSIGRRDLIKIGPGTHRVRIELADSPVETVYVRLRKQYLNPIPRGSNIDKVPHAHHGVREVVVRETRVPYYALRTGEDIKVEVIGPTFMKVIARLDWNTAMSGRQRYMIKAFEDGQLKNTYVLESQRSDVAIYDEKQDSVPGKGDVFYIEVPPGRHEYMLQFKDSGREVNMRCLIPRSSLRNSE